MLKKIVAATVAALAIGGAAVAVVIAGSSGPGAATHTAGKPTANTPLAKIGVTNVQQTQAQLNWVPSTTAHKGVTQYHYAVVDSSGNVAASGDTTERSVVVTGLSSSTTYTWRVSTDTNARHVAARWTPWHTFTTPAGVNTGVGGTGTDGMCANPVFTSAGRQGTWTAPDGLYVNNNAWSNSAGQQTINVCSAKSFSVTSSQPATTSVKTYPSVAWNFDFTPRIGSFTSIDSTFGESIPNTGHWDAAYDMWTDDWNNEIMIWNNQHGQDPAPPGSVPFTVDGVNYHVWKDGSDFVAVYMDTPVKSGSLSILDVFHWLIAHGYMKSSDTLTAIGYGVEISESSPLPETFNITDFSLHTTGTDPGANFSS